MFNCDWFDVFWYLFGLLSILRSTSEMNDIWYRMYFIYEFVILLIKILIAGWLISEIYMSLLNASVNWLIYSASIVQISQMQWCSLFAAELPKKGFHTILYLIKRLTILSLSAFAGRNIVRCHPCCYYWWWYQDLFCMRMYTLVCAVTYSLWQKFVTAPREK